MIEVAIALDTGVDVEVHLLSRETTMKAKRLGVYIPQPFLFGNHKIAHSILHSYMLLCNTINDGFAGSYLDLYAKLPIKVISYTVMVKHLRKLVEMGWLDFQQVQINMDKPLTARNSQYYLTVPPIYDEIFSYVIETGYRL